MHKPSPNRTIDPALVRSFLDTRGNQFVTVSFLKKDGTETTKNGQLKATSRLVGNARGQAQSARMKAAGQVWMALNPKTNGGKESASFFLDRVTEIRAGKAVLRPQPA